MAATTSSLSGARARVLTDARLLTWTLLGLLVWQVGLYFDVWSHLEYGFEIESFLSWSHAALYSGWALTTAPTVLYLVEGQLAGAPARRAVLPPGHLLVLFGGALYGIGGAFDFLWHGLVGFEARHDAALAPSHVWLAIALTLCAFGALQSAVAQSRDAGTSRWADARIGIALGAVLMISHWYVSYASPLATDFATGGAAVRERSGYVGITWSNTAADIGGTTGVFMFNVLVVLVMLFAFRHLRVGTGVVAIALVGLAAFMVPATNQWLVLPSIVVAALTAELLWLRVRRDGWLGGATNWLAFAVIAGSVPLVQTSVYLLVLGTLGGGLIWLPHLWVGVPMAATACGVIVALLVAPPRALTRVDR